MFIDLKQYSKAVEDCDSALKLNPNFIKALYRKSTALSEMTDCEGTDEQSILTLRQAIDVA